MAKIKKLLSTCLVVAMLLSLFAGTVGAANAWTSTDFTLTNAEALTGEDVTVAFKTNVAIDYFSATNGIFSVTAYSDAACQNAVSGISLTAMTPSERFVLGMLDENDVPSGKYSFTHSNPCNIDQNEIIWSATYEVASSVEAGTYYVKLSGLAISDMYGNSLSGESFLATLTIEKAPEALTGNLAITGVTAPVKNVAPATAGDVTAPANTTITSLVWTPSVSGTFAAETEYTATLNIKADDGYAFADGVAFTVNGENCSAEKQNDGSYNLSKTFPATEGKDDPICAAPAGVEATYGQKLSEISLVNPNSNTPGTWSWMDGTQSVGDVGTRTFKAKFTPDDTANYKTVENIDVSVTVGARNITVTIADIADQEYTGSQLKPTVTVTGDNKTLVLNTDYTVEYDTNINVGTNAGSVTVKAKAGSNYTFSDTSKNFNIVAKAGQVTISGDLNVTYGTEVPDVTIDKNGSDGAITVYYYTNEACTEGETTTKPTNAGNYWVKVKMAAGTNHGSAESNVIGFTIARKNISDVTVTLSATELEYTGSAQNVTVTGVTDLTESDYDVTGELSGIDAGEYTVTVNGKGNYTGTATAPWKITPKAVVSNMIAAVADQPYTGSAITPKPAVTDVSALTENTDFTYSYEDNIYVGTATVEINGKGNYTGTASKTFQITPVNQTPAITPTANVTKGGNTLDLKTLVSNAQGTVSFEISGEANGCSITDGILTSGANTGTVKITVNIKSKNVDSAGADEYNAYTGTESITVTIVDKQSASLTVTQNGCTYGETLADPTYSEPDGTTSTVITYNGTLKNGISYIGSAKPTEAGTYTVNVKCETATHIYEGTSASFTIEPKAVAVPAADTTNYIYNCEKQVYIIAASDDYTVSGNEQTNAGNYTVTVALNDKYNTKWSDNTTADKTYIFDISKATPTGTPGYTKITSSGKTLADAALNIGTITPADGTIVWDLGDEQTVSANTSYSWTYTPADTANYNVLTGSITPYVKSSGGGGGGSTIYSIVIEKAENGTVTANKAKASKNETVTLMAKADQGYMLESMTVTTSSGSNVALTERGGGKYTFSMPASKVSVKATFVKRAAGTTSFLDISTDDYFYDAVLWAVEMGITDGTSETTFSPELGCTRAQMVTFLWRASGMPEATITETPFVDVDEYSYYYEALLWAYEVGVTDGTSETTFSPDEICTRGQMAAFMYRHDDKPAVSGDHPFDDVAVNDYYHNAVIWAFGEGITDGTSDNTFSPKNVCTRGQMVTFLYRFLAE